MSGSGTSGTMSGASIADTSSCQYPNTTPNQLSQCTDTETDAVTRTGTKTGTLTVTRSADRPTDPKDALPQDTSLPETSQPDTSQQHSSLPVKNRSPHISLHISTDVLTVEVATDVSVADVGTQGLKDASIDGMPPPHAAASTDSDPPITSDVSVIPTSTSTSTPTSISTPASTPTASTAAPRGVGGLGLQLDPSPTSQGMVDYSPIATGTISDRKKTFSFTPSPFPSSGLGMKGQGLGQGQKSVSGGKSGKSFLTNVGTANYCQR